MTAQASPTPGALARYSLLGVTVLGTMSNNVINVPLHAIAQDFDRPISSAVLTVSAFVLVLAVAMPISGWIGDRFGRKRTLVAALVIMLTAQLAAAAAPTLAFLIGARAVQGLACSAIPPMVMGMLVGFFPARRTRMMGAWAAANGIGQALGPPIGGLISDVAGWRSIFLVMATASLLVLLGIIRSVPSPPGRYTVLHVSGALMLTGGMALLLVAMTAVSQAGTPLAGNAAVAGAGVLLLFCFVMTSRGNPRAMIPPRLIIESRYLRSCVAGFAQMFTLGTVLVLIPLYLTGSLRLSTSKAGILFFALPVSMAMMAPLVSRLADLTSPRGVLRSGMVIIIVGGVVTGLITRATEETTGLVALICTMLVVLGVGMAMVQTPAAVGATRSPAGMTGAGLGLFNMLRFAGSTAGTAWVALMFPRGDMLIVFIGCAAVAFLGLGMSFFGPNPPQPQQEPHSPR